jgi:hypothetical protein
MNLVCEITVALTETHQEYSWPTRWRSSRRPYVAAAPSPDYETRVSAILFELE